MTRPLLPLLAAAGLLAQPADPAFFESKIRPVLVQSCFPCHNSKLKSPMGDLVLDTKSGLRKVSTTRLLAAIKYTNPQLQMPPSGKLPQPVIDNFEAWINAGANDPRPETTTQSTTPLRGMTVEAGRKWWSFQPVHELPAPAVKNTQWLNRKIDAFLLARLEEKGLEPSQKADKRTLAQRLYLDLTGLRPTYEEVESFANDANPNAYQTSLKNSSTPNTTAKSGAAIGSMSPASPKTTQPAKPQIPPTPTPGATAIGSSKPSIRTSPSTNS